MYAELCLPDGRRDVLNDEVPLGVCYSKSYGSVSDVIDCEIIPSLDVYADCYDVHGIADDCVGSLTYYDDAGVQIGDPEFFIAVDLNGYWNAVFAHDQAPL